jgi:hypothetical protein
MKVALRVLAANMKGLDVQSDSGFSHVSVTCVAANQVMMRASTMAVVGTTLGSVTLAVVA